MQYFPHPNPLPLAGEGTFLPYWIAAAHLRGMTSRTFREWLTKIPNIQTLFTSSREDLTNLGMSPSHIDAIQQVNWHQVDKALAWSQHPDHHLITFADPAYPSLLKEIYDPPLLLYTRGNASILAQPQVAMVGSRDASPVGIKNAEHFAHQLTLAGYTVTSGLAKGIDAASHRGALKLEAKTIAVIGTGQNVVYPATHRSLTEAIIAQKGAIVSEFPLDTKPIHYHFPLRNRIITGLSLGVVVVEAAIKSGSLITARLAMEEGREVFAIPGSIHHKQARGCHLLIRQGVKLIESVADIVEELGAIKTISTTPETANNCPKLTPKIPIKELQLLEQIEYAVTPLDEIILRSGLTVSEVSSILLSLELSGYVQSLPGGYMRIDTF